MRVFVTGGTGAIGGHAVPALLAAGHAVTALARTPAKAAALAASGATPAEVSLFDRDALAAAFAGHDAVVNLATAIPSMSRFMSASAQAANRRVRVEGSAAVADAALAAGVPRLVQESVSMIYRDQGDRWIDEDAPVDHYPMARGNHAAEANARRLGEAGGAAVVLRLGWFYGPGAAHSEQLYAQARRHVAMILGHPDGYLSAIHLDDAATAVVAALTAPPGVYNVVDDEPLTKRAFAAALAAAAGARPWVRGPGRAAYLLGDRLTSLTRSLRVANRRLREATGWAPRHRSAREGWRATAAVLDARPGR
ncbi:NAD(P)-dependent oxidoreductase [Actinomadura sp. ATCC 31491]|uniref:NAD(P)-dependent oxidoreductase n=1 Tax=Actinomadura luzonensis TaxID=2805427 RepID=A0ABT0FYZ8_9ACTN|nr:NAD(P)-dependent oxidoreductase [Actinomadura luzonensis]MCK2217170.1 NAD(P)-dependent oxidoreductase [Actinomadura luzonensis]